MFVNCYDWYGLCLFSVTVKEGYEADDLGWKICSGHELIDFWNVSDAPHGAIVRF